VDFVLEESARTFEVDQSDNEINFLLDQVSDDTTFINNIDDILRMMFKDFDNTEEILKEMMDNDTQSRLSKVLHKKINYFVDVKLETTQGSKLSENCWPLNSFDNSESFN